MHPNSRRLRYALTPSLMALSLIACAFASPKASPTATPAAPKAALGYIKFQNSLHPAVYVDYQPGMTYHADGGDKYLVTVTYANGTSIVVDFKITGPEGYLASINGTVTQAPAQDAYLADQAKLADLVAFGFMPGGFAEPLMHLPALCAQDANVHKSYSHVKDRDWLKSLDSITLQCPATGKTHTLAFNYERDLSTTDSLITSFTVTATEAPTP